MKQVGGITYHVIGDSIAFSLQLWLETNTSALFSLTEDAALSLSLSVLLVSVCLNLSFLLVSVCLSLILSLSLILQQVQPDPCTLYDNHLIFNLRIFFVLCLSVSLSVSNTHTHTHARTHTHTRTLTYTRQPTLDRLNYCW